MFLTVNILFKKCFGRTGGKYDPTRDDLKKPFHKIKVPIDHIHKATLGEKCAEIENQKEDDYNWLLQKKCERLTIMSDDGLKLSGFLFKNGDSQKTVVLVHGYKAIALSTFPIIARNYFEKGYNLFIPESRACLESQGEYITFGILEKEDLKKWILKLNEILPNNEFVIFGISLGGTTVCMLSDEKLPESVKVIVSDCAFKNMREQIKRTIKIVAYLPEFPVVNICEFWFKHYTGLTFKEGNALEHVKKSRLPMFFITGTGDKFVLPNNTKDLYDACPREKELVFIEGAQHAQAHIIGKEDYYVPMFRFTDKYISK